MNLGGIYTELGNLDQALASTLKSLELEPDNPTAHMNLGGIYTELGNFDQALASTLKSLEINPDNPTAHTNLGSIYHSLKNQDRALKSILKSLEINPMSTDALHMLSNIKLQSGDLQEAQTSITKAIKLNPDKALYRLFLGLIFCAKGDIKQAVESQKAVPPSRTLSKSEQFYALALSISIQTLKEGKNPTKTLNHGVKFPIILQREVEPELIKTLYELKPLDFNHITDPTYGQARGSSYDLFKSHGNKFQTLEKDLEALIKSIFNSEIYIKDSFYTILSGESIVKRHNHLNNLDKIKTLGIGEKSFSLVYYLETGDQECSDPGILKFYEPEEEILPFKGMVIIFPGKTEHSVTYNGKKDRIIIAVNFYSRDIPTLQ